MQINKYAKTEMLILKTFFFFLQDSRSAFPFNICVLIFLLSGKRATLNV